MTPSLLLEAIRNIILDNLSCSLPGALLPALGIWLLPRLALVNVHHVLLEVDEVLEALAAGRAVELGAVVLVLHLHVSGQGSLLPGFEVAVFALVRPENKEKKNNFPR